MIKHNLDDLKQLLSVKTQIEAKIATVQKLQEQQNRNPQQLFIAIFSEKTTEIKQVPSTMTSGFGQSIQCHINIPEEKYHGPVELELHDLAAAKICELLVFGLNNDLGMINQKIKEFLK